MTRRFWRAAFLAVAGVLLMSALAHPAGAMTRSEHVALVPNAHGKFDFGGVLPTAIAGAPGVPAGYAPVFADVSPDAIADGSVADPLSGFDTAVLVGLCDIGSNYLSDPDFKTRIESFVSLGGKLIIWDSECENTDYSNFVYPFATDIPAQGGFPAGTLIDVEENTLSTTDASDQSTNSKYIDAAAVTNGTDAVGDTSVMTSFDVHWCVDFRASNNTGVQGPTQTYAHLGSGLIVYSGLDKDYMSTASFDPSPGNGPEHLQRIWLLELLQPFNPDALPCTVKLFGLALSPPTATNPATPGTPHTVTAHVEKNGGPLAGVVVNFLITGGPNEGQSATVTTDANGDATFTYTHGSTATGTDTIVAAATVEDQNGQQTFVADTAEKTWEPTGPSYAAVADFAVHWTPTAMRLSWRTTSEAGILGFVVWRKEAAKSPWQRLSRTPIAAKEAGRSRGARYRLFDAGARAGRTYVYRLQTIDLTGKPSPLGASPTRRAAAARR